MLNFLVFLFWCLKESPYFLTALFEIKKNYFQDPSVWYAVLGVVLATATAVVGSQVLSYNYYHDHWLVLFCLVLCSCQYR